MTLLAMQDQIMPALGRVRSILYEVQVQTEQTAIEHERMAAWHTKRGEQAAARMERRGRGGTVGGVRRVGARPATTHWASLGLLAELDPTIEVRGDWRSEDSRWVSEGHGQ